MKVVNVNSELTQKFFNLKKREIDLSKIGMSSRVFNYNKKIGIIDYEIDDPEGKRRKIKLNYFEAFWLVIIQKLRNFGISDAVLIQLKEFLHDSFFNSFDKQGIDQIKEIIKTKIQLPEGLDPEIDLELLIEQLKTVPDDQKIFSTSLASIISNLLIRSESPVLILFGLEGDDYEMKNPIGFCFEGSPGHDALNQLKEFSGVSIRIPLKKIHEKLFDLELKDEVYQNYRLISDQEKEVLEIIRKGEFKELKITGANGDLRYKVKNNGNIRGDAAKEIRKLLGIEAGGKINLQIRNDQHIYFERE